MHIFSLEGRTALITGASRGIGYTIASALASAGARVVLNARSKDALSDAAETLSATGAAVDIERFDVTDAEAVRDGVERIEARSPIDIVVNNAGMQRRAPLESFNDDDWRAIMSTNVDSVYYVSKSVAPFKLPPMVIKSVTLYVALPTISFLVLSSLTPKPLPFINATA